MEGFCRLVSYFQTQSEINYCGLASLSVVLNALAIDPGRIWKGPWRWIDESMLDCCEPLEEVKVRGISFEKLVCLGRCAGAKVEAFHADQSNIDEFRKHVMKCSTCDDCYVISLYHRAAIKQVGTGHFSPIGGYHAEKDMVLILDVARFKYPPHWVSIKALWEGMNYVDEATGRSRGFMLISRNHKDPGLLYTLSCEHESWINIAKFIIDDVPLLLKSEDVKDIQKVLSVIITSLPSNFREFIKCIAEFRRQENGSTSLSPEEKAWLDIKEELLKQVQETPLFKHVASFLSNSCFVQLPASGIGFSISNIPASVCCQGAEILGGSSALYCNRKKFMKCLNAEGDKLIRMVCATVSNGNNEQGLDFLIPSPPGRQHCCSSVPPKYINMHPASSVVLTLLLLSLPSTTWDGIRDKQLLRELDCLVSTQKLPNLLQQEVLRLRGSWCNLLASPAGVRKLGYYKD
ncbi:hypothetical protein L6164_034385 [Bauhinia variegata]|uniref:Uncharacterized protein n=1 Tax=Bauhinia variegata TaxID=167791 RepID=A0ACB9KV24_BAUVA|nr:hypothetical protein L6164_034385 [Bauhinia variegata]